MPKVTQEEAYKFLTTKKDNVFLTGAGGVGKSYIIKKFVDYLDTFNISYGLTSSTGVSAQIIGGQTIHSFSGMGIKTDLEDVVTNKWWRTKTKPVLKDIKVLIIDEVSMLGALSFELLDLIFQNARESEEFFGGVRVVLTGDFFQLPPVRDDFCFLSEAWELGKFKILNLFKNMRADNLEWANILRKIRVGEIDESVEDIFNTALKRKVPPDRDIVRLYSLNKQVSSYNQKKLDNIQSKPFVYKYSVIDKKNLLNPMEIQRFFDTASIHRELTLKVGAFVMVKVNSTGTGDDGKREYVNGTTGHVVELFPDAVLVELETGKVIRFGYHSFSIRKKVNNLNFGKVYENQYGNQDLDLRQFVFETAEILQIPLVLAWAISIHSSQGSTLKEAVIDLGRGFEDGQGYVALSRLKAHEGLYMSEYPNPRCLSVSEDVLDFVDAYWDDFTVEMKK